MSKGARTQIVLDADLETHSRKFVNFVVNEIERVRKETKGISL